MATIDARNANEGFDFTGPKVALASAFSATASIYDWSTTGGGAIFTTGSGYTYSGGIPTDGTVHSIGLALSGDFVPDIVITGIFDLEKLSQPTLTAAGFVNAFWREALKGADLIIAPNDQAFSIAGDARDVTAELFGRNDRIVGGTGGPGGSPPLAQVLTGDAQGNSGFVAGGNDIITGPGDFFLILIGDVNTNFASGITAGGDDSLTINSSFAGKIAVGDAFTNDGKVFGGDDTIVGSEGADSALVGDVYSNRGFLSGGDDVIHGRGGDDFLFGETTSLFGSIVIGGNDQLFGDAGNDGLSGDFGSDFIDGGADSDTAFFFGLNMTGAQFIRVGGTTYVSQIASPQLDTDTLVNIETITTNNGSFAPTSVAEFAGLIYAATYSDLTAAFSGLGSAEAIRAAAAQHFAFNGYFEGRFTEGYLPFDSAQYKANYGDLAGLDDVGARLHFIQHGFAEGRLGFDAMAYIASHADLRAAFGTDEAAALQHWHSFGRFEGRHITFDARQYLDNYGDLQVAFGDDLAAAASHFVANGAAENRTDIDPLDYVASHPDLVQAFGDFGNAPKANVVSTGLSHYVNDGRAEGRGAAFDAWQYLLNYQDLREAFGTDVDAGAHHFIQFGFYEGRTDLDIFA